jgi:hypothetical protein
MKKMTVFIALVLLLFLFTTPAYAVPALPHAFYGSVTLNNAAAPNRTQVSATVSGRTVITNAQNPVTTAGGSYGINSPYLLVQGDIPDGATITFHVTNTNGTATGGTATFQAGGGPTQNNLSVTIRAPSGDGGGGGAPAPTTVVTSLFGTAGSFKIDSAGIVQTTVTATSADGNLTITIPQGTKALDKNGNPLTTLTTNINTSPPPPPAGANIIALAYTFGPDGATFNPPITLTWSYDPGALPAGVAEEDLVIAYYDVTTGTWVELQGVVDAANNRITASVSHFTTFAIIGTAKPAAFSLSSLAISPTTVAPSEKVNISVSMANTGNLNGSYTVVLNINGVKEVEQSVTVAAGSSQTVSFSVAREKAGSYSVTIGGLNGSFTVAPAPSPTPTPQPTNWPLIGGIIGGVIVVVLLIFFLVRRRAD